MVQHLFVTTFETIEQETQFVANWILTILENGGLASEIGVFVRSTDELKRAKSAIKLAGQTSSELSEKVEIVTASIAVGTMHFAKGLEFRYVAVMACDDEVIPLQERIETVSDESDLREVYDTERHLLYVACTRARDQLLVTAVEPASEFLDDFKR